MNQFTCTFIRTRPRVDDYTRACAAKIPDAGGVCLGIFGEDRFKIGARSASGPCTSRRVSKWATGRAIRSLGQLTSKPSLPLPSARAGMSSRAKSSTKRRPGQPSVWAHA